MPEIVKEIYRYDGAFCAIFSPFQPIFITFAAYDTRTNQKYEGPCGRPEEVSLTSITANTRSMKKSSYR
jgi:hypothetical protein